MRPTDKSANVKERYKSVERSYGKGAQCTKQCKVGKMQRKHKRGHTFQCVFVGVYKCMYLYYSVYTIDYNYEISHIFFFRVSCFTLHFRLPVCFNHWLVLTESPWRHLEFEAWSLFLKLEDSLFGRVGGTEGVWLQRLVSKSDQIGQNRQN